MALIKSAIAVFLVLAVISSTSISCVSATCTGCPTPKPKPATPCFHAGSSPHPCTVEGCKKLCEHHQYKSDLAYCKSVSPGECCCPNE
ncbi:hypothetical protein EJB05_30961 [Eragrostis curvula]|uniref:Bowman-Birk serine protease inhibitors family domain-containing protein n=1 Tax=Eragrostis curvula TaxID=38414 RepID=A0A5J9UCB9_9POAL|nr:hypothetical protein EJB05_30961 [Eragrostis curvula]